MWTIRGQKNTILIILIGSTTLIVLTTLFFMKLPTGPALAQEGDNGLTKATQAHQNRNAGIATPVDASAEAEEIGSQSDGSGIEVVPIAAFRNDGDSGNGWLHLFGGGYIQNDSSNMVCFMAPTYPPNGSTLTQFRFSALNISSNDLLVYLDRVRLATGQFETVAGGGVITLNPPPVEAFVSVPADVASVSNAYAYYVDFCFPANSGDEMQFYGARLFYNP